MPGRPHDPDMYLRLGKVVGNGQALELLITLLLMKTLRNREAAPRIAGRLGVAQTLDLIGEPRRADRRALTAVGRASNSERCATAIG